MVYLRLTLSFSKVIIRNRKGLFCMSLLSIIARVRLSADALDMKSCSEESLASMALKSPRSLPFMFISSVFGSTTVGSAGKIPLS